MAKTATATATATASLNTMEKAFSKVNVTAVLNGIDLVASQLKGQPASIVEAAKDGYRSGHSYRNTKVRECPYASDTREYRFWVRGFDYGMADSKRVVISAK